MVDIKRTKKLRASLKADVREPCKNQLTREEIHVVLEPGMHSSVAS